MPSSGYYVISYDLSANPERRRASRVLQSYGMRVHESVFECRLTTAMRRRLERQLARLQLRSGSLLIYRRAGESRRTEFGLTLPPSFDESSYAIVV